MLETIYSSFGFSTARLYLRFICLDGKSTSCSPSPQLPVLPARLRS